MVEFNAQALSQHHLFPLQNKKIRTIRDLEAARWYTRVGHMVLRMPSPTLIGNTYYVRVRVPADLRQHYRRPEVKRSLGTSDAAAAKALFAEAYADLQLEWRGLRSDAVRLTDRQITALAGLRYKDWIGHRGDAGRFAHIRELSEGVAGRVERLETWYGHAADRLLTAEGIKTDLDSRTRLLHQFHRSDLQAVAQLERQADGDYRPDPMEDRFPELMWPEPVEACPPKESAQITLTALFELWKRDHLANGNGLAVPDNLSLLTLPPYAPELNPVENVWQYATPARSPMH